MAGVDKALSPLRILSMAASAEGRHAQAFPSFGSERMGAPVVSFCRIDDLPIRTREPATAPDALVVQDVTLIHQVDLFVGLSSQGYVLVNTSQRFDELDAAVSSTISVATACVRAQRPSLRSRSWPTPPNGALVGGFAALTGEIPLKRSTGPSASGSPGTSANATSPQRERPFASSRWTMEG